MKNNSCIIVSQIAMLLAILLLAAILWAGLPHRDSVLLALALLALACLALLAGLRRRFDARISGDLKQKDRLLTSLARTFVSVEQAMAGKDLELSDCRAEISRLAESGANAKAQISLLRSEIASLKTKNKECRQIIEKLRQRAEMSDRLKAALMANIKDELGNPLNSILGYAQFLTSPSLPESRKQEYLGIIARDSRRFLDTVYDLFYYSRLMVGDVEPVITTFNINALLENAVSIARQQSAAAGKSIEVSLRQSAAPGFIGGFEAGYVKILSNLLSNAVKFTSEGRVDVRCSVEGSMARISVEDTGIGFSLSNRGEIFEPFFQADLSLSRKYSGTGLGLAICRALASLMGGSLMAESREGAGSKFTLEVPVMSLLEPDMDVYCEAERILRSGGARRRMLMITPFNEDYDFVSRFMNSYGIETVRSNSAEESDSLVAQYGDIALTIIDLYSWTPQGVEAAERIFRLKPGMKFAFISNVPLEPLQFESIRSYTDIVLRKPFTSLDLSKLLVGLG